MEPKEPLSEREIVAILDSYHESSISTRSSELSKDRAQALRYYNMEPYGDETDTSSKAVTSEVFDAVEALATGLVKVFTSTDRAVEFIPEGPEDEKAADQKTKYCNHIFYRENNGFLVLYEAIKGGLLMKNGIIKVYPEFDSSVKEEQYHGLTEMQAATLAQDDDTEFTSANWYYDDDGTPLFDIETRRVQKDVKIRVQAIPPEELSVAGWHNSVLLDDCDFIQHRTRMSVTVLREMGIIDQDEDIMSLGGSGFDEDDLSEEELARDEENEERRFRDTNPIQKEMRRLVVKDIVARVDVDGDGIAERRRIIRIGNTIRYNEPTDDCGYGVFAPIIMPHRFIGKSYADLMMQWQRIQSQLIRQTLNNIYLSNHQRPIVTTVGGIPQADMESLMTTGPGLPIFERTAGAVRYAPPPPIAQDIIGVSEVVRQAGETRTGITRLSQGINPDAITKTAAGAAILTENANEREELQARVFAETCLKPVFKSIAHLTRKYQDRKKLIRIYNEFIEIDPSAWSESYDMSINVGLGSGTARQTTVNIEKLMEKQLVAVQGGGLGTLVTAENLYNAAAKFTETLGFKDPSPYWNDPSTVEPKPPEPSIEEKQLETLKEIEQLKALLKKMEVESHAKEAEDKNETDLIKAAIEGRVRLEIADKEADIRSMVAHADLHKSFHKNRTDTEIAVMDAIGRLDSEETHHKARIVEEQLKHGAALALEDKKVVNLRKPKAATKTPERTSTVKMTAKPDGSYEIDKGDGAKAVIKPTEDEGFEIETTRERRKGKARAAPASDS